MQLSDNAKRKRKQDFERLMEEGSTIDQIAVFFVGVSLLVRCWMHNGLTPGQRKVIYILAALTGGALFILGLEYPALALVMGIIIGIIIAVIARL